MARPRPPNWEKVRVEYMKGGISIEKLAEKHGIPLGTLKTRSTKEKWGRAKSETHEKVMQGLPGRIAPVVLDEVERTTREQLDDLSAARLVARSLLAGVDDTQALKDWATAYKAIQSCQRIALGVDKERVDTQASPGIVALPAQSDDWADLLSEE